MRFSSGILSVRYRGAAEFLEVTIAIAGRQSVIDGNIGRCAAIFRTGENRSLMRKKGAGPKTSP
jgi:hypothetical protein